MEIILIATAAFLGAMAVALLGWTATDEPFNLRKFTSSVIRGVIGAIGITAAFDYAGPAPPLSYLIAFLAGAGIDAGGKRIAAAFITKTKMVKKNVGAVK